MTSDPRFQFRRDLFRSIGSSGVTLAITLVSTPLMTRLFPAEAYGVNGIMMTAATLVSSFGLLGLPVALTREQGSGDYPRLLNASVQMAIFLSVLCAGITVVLLMIPGIRSREISPAVSMFFPVMALVMSVQRVSDAQVTARGLFQAGAAARIVNSIVTRGLSLGAGFLLQPVAMIMLVSDSLGKLSQILVIARMTGMGQGWSALRWWPQPRFLAHTLKEYRHFAFQANLAAALPLVTGLTVQSMLVWRIGTAANGQFVLAQSILTLPVSLIALASAPVVFHRLVKAADEAPDSLAGLALRAFFLYVAAGAICMLPVILFGPALFAFVFGESWRVAGSLAAMIAVPQIFSFSLTGILSLFRVTRRLGAWLVFEAIGSAIVICGMLLLSETSDLTAVVDRMVVLLLAYHAVMHLGCLWAVGGYGKARS